MKKLKSNPLIRILLDNPKNLLWLLVIIILIITSGVFQAAIASIFGQIVDLGVAGDISVMKQKVWSMIAFLLMECMRMMLYTVVTSRGTEQAINFLRMQIFRVVSNLPLYILETKIRTGDLIARFNSDLSHLSTTITSNFTWLLKVFLTAIVAIISCLILSWQLSLVYFTILPISVIIMNKVSRNVQDQHKIKSQNMGKAMNLATNLLRGLLTSKSYNLSEEMNRCFAEADKNVVDAAVSAEKTSVKMTLVKYLFNLISVVVLFLFGSILIKIGAVTLGQIIAFITLSQNVRTALELIDNMFYHYRTALADATRIYEILDLDEEKEGQVFFIDENAPVVEAKNLTFGYEGKPPLFNGLSFSISKGEVIGIAGVSGCGKSSIIKLICGFYPHKGGKLLLFGHPIEDWSLEALRTKISIVTQDPFLFDGTIYENVLMGRPDASYEEVMSAIKKANLLDFINTLPEGVDTRVGERGARLSGGQRQRITIARAFLKDAPILLLDEFTSALDAKTEQEVLKALESLKEGRTVLIVSHRASAIQNVNNIFSI